MNRLVALLTLALLCAGLQRALAAPRRNPIVAAPMGPDWTSFKSLGTQLPLDWASGAGQRVVLFFDSLPTTVARLWEASAARVPVLDSPLLMAFGRGMWSAVWVGASLSAEAAGGIPDDLDNPLDAMRSYTTHKFLVGLGAAWAELLILSLVYREPCNNHRRGLMQRRASTPLAWVLLVVLLTVPVGIPLGVVVVCLAQLSDPVYVPAIITSNLLRPYVVAGLRACPYVMRMYLAYMHRWGLTDTDQTVAEAVLWVIVVAAVSFLAAVRGTVHDPSDPEAEVDSEVEPEVPKIRTKAKARTTKE